MFSSALKSLSSNISSNYSIAQQPSIVCGPWKIFDGRKRSGGKAVSIFVFERKSIEPTGGLRSGASNVKQAQDEIVERLKKEASALARLRHPSILELAEPVEETRSGGLTFATEPVTASLASLLEEKDEQEQAGGVAGKSSKYVVEDPAAGARRRREVEIDELEIQKGLLQVAKGLEFLHESARLVHANLTPEAIFINAKSDWKISGLGFSTPPQDTNSPSAAPLQLSEVLNYDTRLPKFVQLNLDYSSPDLVMDSNVTTAADMFSLGLIIIALYNTPHRTPLDTSHSVSTYKRLLSAPGTTPTPRNNFLSSRPIPKEIISSLLPRLITRRPAARISAREFQQTQYFDSILVSTLRFLDNLPAKTPNEKSQFMRGLPRIMAQFPKSVLEKKILPALLDEMKDHDLLSQILENAFKIVGMVPNGNRVFSEKVVPRLREIFLGPAGKSKAQERDTSKEGGLLVILENMTLVSTHCTSKEFKDDILPIIFFGLDSPTHSIQDAALSTMTLILPVLDFSTIKNDLFPAVAHVFSRTSSMGIKIKGLEALNILCGGSVEDTSFDGSSLMPTKTEHKASSSSTLDKYTVQEKVVPLLKGIKTKEPTVMMAALNVFTQVGKVADSAFLALDVIPTLWQFSLGPLLNLEQFQSFMALIKSLSAKIEEEQTRKLQQLSSAGRTTNTSIGNANGVASDDSDFETLVTGRKTNSQANNDSWDGGWETQPATRSQSKLPAQKPLSNSATPTFSWSTTTTNTSLNSIAASAQQVPRTITPDTNMMSSYTSLQPSNKITAPSSYQSPPLQPSNPQSLASLASRQQPNYSSSSTAQSPSSSAPINWSSLNNKPTQSNPWPSTSTSSVRQPQNNASPGTTNVWSTLSPTSPPASSSPSLSSQNPRGAVQQNTLSNSLANINIAGPPKNQTTGAGGFGQTAKTGLDKYDSLL